MPNQIEEWKREKAPLDVLPDIHRYAQLGFAAITKDDKARFRWYGIYSQVPNDGNFMLRIKIPGGALSQAQVLAIAALAEEYAHGFADITTRQDIQLHWLTIEQMPDVFARLRQVGLTTTEACGDCVRNVIGCPVAGLDAQEAVDAHALVREVTEHFVGNPEFENLPRKFKIGITGCRENCIQAEMQDVGLTPAQRDGEWGFNLRVGGGLSTQPMFARAIDVFVGRDEVLPMLRGVVGIFRDDGYRDRRNRARLKFLVADWGEARFRAELEARVGRPLRSAGSEDRHWVGDHHMGIHPQKQPGFSYAGLVVPAGRISAAQLAGVARLSAAYGQGEVRLTGSQNLIIPWLPNARLSDLLSEPLLQELQPAPPAFSRRLVTCTGEQFCNFGQIETKERARRLAAYLDEQFPGLEEPIRIHLTGCPNACAQWQVGDIALLGVRARIDNEIVPAIDIAVGGGFGPTPTFATLLRRRVPDTEAGPALARLVRGWLQHRQPGESFRDYVHREEPARLVAWVGGADPGSTFGIGDAPQGRLATEAPAAGGEE